MAGKGQPKTGGRQKGTLNKVTDEVAELRRQLRNERWRRVWAEERLGSIRSHRAAIMRLLDVPTLPLNVAAGGEASIQV